MAMNLRLHQCPKCSHYPVAGQSGGVAICQKCYERLDSEGRSIADREQAMVAAYALKPAI